MGGTINHRSAKEPIVPVSIIRFELYTAMLALHSFARVSVPNWIQDHTRSRCNYTSHGQTIYTHLWSISSELGASFRTIKQFLQHIIHYDIFRVQVILFRTSARLTPV